MTLKLPLPVARYFQAANGADADDVAACFTPDAHVRDEGRDHVGRAAIRAWAGDARSRYDFHAEPRSLTDPDGAPVVTAHLTGDFPGAPADLRYRFELSGGAISHLEVTA
jgi:ketosteroid isomerase-like protein